MTKKATTTIIALALIIVSCQRNQNNNIASDKNSKAGTIQEIDRNSSIYGNYVDDSYQNRNEGYDWVAVLVKKDIDNSILISVRSRADKKKPTCTFDARAYQKDYNTYESVYNGKKIKYQFLDKSIIISSKEKKDENLLYFFCSGGASFAGRYTKINEPLDSSQVDQTNFIKVLNLHNVGFNVSAIETDGRNMLTVFTFGLERKDYNETFNLEDYYITDAEVEDLNSDGSPELIIFTQKPGRRKYGNVLAFSVNNMKSMSQVYFPATEENTKINSGYKGNDEFSIIETSLVQRFPVYRESDSISNPTGGMRQVSYKLLEGEAMRKLEVADISSK